MVRFVLPALILIATGMALPVAALAGNPAGAAASNTTLGVGGSTVTGPGVDATETCEIVAPPPSSLDTPSKYNQAIGSKSIADPVSAQVRSKAMSPVTDAIRRLEATGRFGPGQASPTAAACVFQTLDIWAREGSLTQMRSEDANLSRDRFMVSITALIADLDPKGDSLSRHDDVRRWLAAISMQTMRFYDIEAGPISRRNNHRYWAGLSVGQTGMLLKDHRMTDWARSSLETGLCQIDGSGFLPLEVDRAAKAFDYHLYAYVALGSLDRLLGPSEPGRCSEALLRLGDLVRDGMRSDVAFERRTGVRQDKPSRDNLLKARRLLQDRLSPGTGSEF